MKYIVKGIKIIYDWNTNKRSNEEVTLEYNVDPLLNAKTPIRINDFPYYYGEIELTDNTKTYIFTNYFYINKPQSEEPPKEEKKKKFLGIF
jgi:hypothetical protein